jgi:ABC-type glycerol-3-phosphate transport system substrate-binding protein
MRRAVMLAVLPLLAAGCAGQPPAAPESPVTADQVTVHDSVVSAPMRYRVIKRYWTESLASAFYVPSYKTKQEAAEKFKQYAASLGGNGVLNFGCYRKNTDENASLRCNGTVVRFQ